MNIGIIGCGNISNQYLRNAADYDNVTVAACADLNMDAARAQAEKYGVPRACTVDELLADEAIELVVNLTIPAAHATVAIRALEAGKHTYHEKPFSVTREEGQAILDAAQKAGRRVGCAPDTFLGAGNQTARKLIDDGVIGEVTCVTAFVMGPGHESWHPSPEFYYKPGGGPMMDMGPYYLTALINLLGPIRSVTGQTNIFKPKRTITSEPLSGKVIDVETPDHVQGGIEFESGALGTIVTSFAACGGGHHPITVFGTDGVLQVSDPNGFDGGIRIKRDKRGDFEDVEHTHATGFGRMVGVSDMIDAIENDRPSRASGELAFAVLDAMLGFFESADARKPYDLVASCDRPAAMEAANAAAV